MTKLIDAFRDRAKKSAYNLFDIRYMTRACDVIWEFESEKVCFDLLSFLVLHASDKELRDVAHSDSSGYG